jgi:NTP pyrophosphatase (non-canonical NTP hydrolase)
MFNGMISTYQRLAARTSGQLMDGGRRKQNALWGLIGESGELVELLKKRDFHGTPFESDKFESEAGDVLWYLAEFASAYEADLGYIVTKDLLRGDVAPPVTFSTFQKHVAGENYGFEMIDDPVRDEIAAIILLSKTIGKLAQIFDADFLQENKICDYVLEMELMNVLFGLTWIVSINKFDLQQIAGKNIEKLAKRYPERFIEGGGIRE